MSIINKPLSQVILFQIDRTSKTARNYSQQEFDKVSPKVTIDQWVLLKVIEENEGASQKVIADKSVRDQASVTRTLDLLEKKGLVRRSAIPGNRRQYQIELTLSGRTFIDDNMEMVNRHRAKSLEGFSQAEIETLHSMLVRIQENMT